MYRQFTSGLYGYLKTPLTLEQSRLIIHERLQNRQSNLLTIVRRAIYDNAASPYLKLLRIAGCEYGDFTKLVQREGIEDALHALYNRGVYLSIEEFKGRQEVKRGSQNFSFKEEDFDNPLVLRGLEFTSSGSRGKPTRTIYDFNYLTYGRAVYVSTMLEGFSASGLPVIIWSPIMPGSGPRKVLSYAKIRERVVKWYSPVRKKGFKPSLRNRLGTKYIVSVSRICGMKTSSPRYLSLEQAWQITELAARLVREAGGCIINTNPSHAVKICLAAKERNLSLNGVRFVSGAEPVTAAKRNEIESAGAVIFPRYASTEFGFIGLGCFNPSTADDMHLAQDALAVIQEERMVLHSDSKVNSFLFTSLMLSAPKIVLNVESGDYGIVAERSCGCYWDKLGFTTHLHTVRSFEKLTSEGMTVFASNLLHIMEEVLPAVFGGHTIDYQMVEKEDDKGNTHLNILVNPELGIIDEGNLKNIVISELGKGQDVQRMMATIWQDADTLRVIRQKPQVNNSGKLLPLHIQKKK